MTELDVDRPLAAADDAARAGGAVITERFRDKLTPREKGPGAGPRSRA